LSPGGAADLSTPRHDSAQLDFSLHMGVGDRLQPGALLSAQQPLSPAHDEMQFIVQQQTSELGMKLMLHGLRAAVATDLLMTACKMLVRTARILAQRVHAWDVLATMARPEYSAIRPCLGQSSGLQSWQYRGIAFMWGHKSVAMLKPSAHCPVRLAEVEAAWRAPLRYGEALRLLAGRGLALPASRTNRDGTAPCAADEVVKQAWWVVYRAPTATGTRTR
jgi:tryptophan 2,3-dioxygenase